MRIGVDLDNCVADLWRCALPLCNQFFGKEVRLSDITQWEMWECIGVSKEEFMDYHDACLGGAVVIEPVTEAPEALRRLSQEGHEVTIVTARDQNFGEETERWLDEHGLGDIQLMMGQQDKRAAGSWDTFVDDNLDVCLDLSPSVPLVFLFNQPWNQARSLPRGMVRVSSWRGSTTIRVRQAGDWVEDQY